MVHRTKFNTHVAAQIISNTHTNLRITTRSPEQATSPKHVRTAVATSPDPMVHNGKDEMTPGARCQTKTKSDQLLERRNERARERHTHRKREREQREIEGERERLNREREREKKNNACLLV